MEQLTTNLPWLIIWVAVILLQNWFLQKKNYFASLLTLWAALLVSIFWDRVLETLVPGVDAMWLFGTKIWILFFILAVRHYLSRRKPAPPVAAAEGTGQEAGAAQQDTPSSQPPEEAPKDPLSAQPSAAEADQEKKP